MIDIRSEMQKLKINVEFNVKKYYRKKIPEDFLNSFKEDNWLLSFPFNFSELYGVDPDITRKLAVINSLYIGTFLKEDFLLDDYNASIEIFGKGVRAYCFSRLLSILAVRQYVYHCGEIILKYLFMYEEIYYASLFKEKNIISQSIHDGFIHENLLFLGQKLLPLVTSFAGYCIIIDKESLIPVCEEMIIDYHIAKQLYDDFIDIKNDFFKPDRSYLIKLISGMNENNALDIKDLYEFVLKNDLDYKITDIMSKYLKKSREKAEELGFGIFQKEISLLYEYAENYNRK